MVKKDVNALLIEIGDWQAIANGLGYSVSYTKRACQLLTTRVFRLRGIAGLPAFHMRSDRLIEIARAMSFEKKVKYSCRGIGIVFVKVTEDVVDDWRVIVYKNSAFYASDVIIDGRFVDVQPDYLGVV